MAAQLLEAGAHHQGVGLAAEVGLLASGHLNGGDEGPAGGGDAVFNGAGDIGVGADELGPRHHQVRGLGKGVQGVGPPLPHHHVLRVHVIHGDAGVVEGVEEARLADGEDGAAGSLVPEEGRRGESAGVEVLLRDIQPHAGQLLLELPGGIAAVVGEEEVLLPLRLEPLDELRHAGEDAVAMVDDTVHIADEALFGVEINPVADIHKSFASLSFVDGPMIPCSAAGCQSSNVKFSALAIFPPVGYNGPITGREACPCLRSPSGRWRRR